MLIILRKVVVIIWDSQYSVGESIRNFSYFQRPQLTSDIFFCGSNLPVAFISRLHCHAFTFLFHRQLPAQNRDCFERDKCDPR